MVPLGDERAPGLLRTVLQGGGSAPLARVELWGPSRTDEHAQLLLHADHLLLAHGEAAAEEGEVVLGRGELRLWGKMRRRGRRRSGACRSGSGSPSTVRGRATHVRLRQARYQLLRLQNRVVELQRRGSRRDLPVVRTDLDNGLLPNRLALDQVFPRLLRRAGVDRPAEALKPEKRE